MGTCRAAGEQIEHRPIERGKIGGLTARHLVIVLQHLVVHPVAARIANIIPDGVVAGQPATLHQARRDEQPEAVADRGAGLA